MTTWASGVARTLLSNIIDLGRELDHRSRCGEEHLKAGSLQTWASKVAPAAQGGYAAVSRAMPPHRFRSPIGWHVARPSEGAQPAAMVVEPRGPLVAGDGLQPQLVAQPRGMIVVAKPVNWEVDGLTSEAGGARPLSAFVQSILPRNQSTLVHTVQLDFGFIHRLDVPSSGLVLGGTTLEGLFHLKWQIAVYAIARQYITSNHGRLAQPLADVSERIDASTAENLRSITDEHGKPARSALGVLAHFCACEHGLLSKVPNGPAGGCRVGEAGLCLLAIAIHTGRRHQIRAHTRHLGHPTVTDARYTPRDVHVRRSC